MVPGFGVAPLASRLSVRLRQFAPLRPALCFDGSTFITVAAMGVAMYLALVAGGLSAAFLSAVILKGVKLI
ncbi:MAG: hypothetical protein WCQ20_02720 [Synechococcaceae cyanobacterium ELA739]|jgi:hypothetical protein